MEKRLLYHLLIHLKQLRHDVVFRKSNDDLWSKKSLFIGIVTIGQSIGFLQASRAWKSSLYWAFAEGFSRFGEIVYFEVNSTIALASLPMANSMMKPFSISKRVGVRLSPSLAATRYSTRSPFMMKSSGSNSIAMRM